MIFRMYPSDGIGGKYDGNGSGGPPTKRGYGFVTIGLTVVGTFLGIIAPPTLFFTVPMVGYGGYKYLTMDE